MGLGRPILHGLATMGITARVAAEAMSAHPADLSAATVRFSKPVYPGLAEYLRLRESVGSGRFRRSLDRGRGPAVIGE